MTNPLYKTETKTKRKLTRDNRWVSVKLTEMQLAKLECLAKSLPVEPGSTLSQQALKALTLCRLIDKAMAA
jgi:hypothetical protein